MTFSSCRLERVTTDDKKEKFRAIIEQRYFYFWTIHETSDFDTLEEAQYWLLSKRCDENFTNDVDDIDVITNDDLYQPPPVSELESPTNIVNPIIYNAHARARARAHKSHKSQNQEDIKKELNYFPQLCLRKIKFSY